MSPGVHISTEKWDCNRYIKISFKSSSNRFFMSKTLATWILVSFSAFQWSILFICKVLQQTENRSFLLSPVSSQRQQLSCPGAVPSITGAGTRAGHLSASSSVRLIEWASCLGLWPFIWGVLADLWLAAVRTTKNKMFTIPGSVYTTLHNMRMKYFSLAARCNILVWASLYHPGRSQRRRL